MTIALLAHDNRKELMCEFCSAYSSVLERHKLVATSATATRIKNYAKLNDITVLLPGSSGGVEQITSKICYGEVDIVIMFRDADRFSEDEHELDLIKACDKYHVPYATNMITGEIIVRSLDKGELDWLEYDHRKNNLTK